MLFKKKSAQAKKGILMLLLMEINYITSYAETLSPERFIEFLSHYVEESKCIIKNHHGNIASIKGDCILSAWSEEQDGLNSKCLSACRAAVSLIRQMAKMSTWLSNRGYPKKASLKISICRGECIYEEKGNLFTHIFGSTVNRVNNISRSFNSDRDIILVDEAIKTICTDFAYKRVQHHIYEMMIPDPLNHEW